MANYDAALDRMMKMKELKINSGYLEVHCYMGAHKDVRFLGGLNINGKLNHIFAKFIKETDTDNSKRVNEVLRIEKAAQKRYYSNGKVYYAPPPDYFEFICYKKTDMRDKVYQGFLLFDSIRYNVTILDNKKDSRRLDIQITPYQADKYLAEQKFKNNISLYLDNALHIPTDIKKFKLKK